MTSFRTPYVIRVYLNARRAQEALGAAAEAVFTGVWLGLLNRDHLHQIDRARYDRSASYHEDAHNLRGLFPWEEAALRGYFADQKHLLVIGAGGGREIIALAKRGFVVNGCECHPDLVASGNERLMREGINAIIEEAARDCCPDLSKHYDGLIVGWSAYMLIAGSKQRIEFLRQARALLPENGPVLVSFFSRDSANRRLKIVKAVGGVLRRLRGGEPLELGDDLVPNYVHRFTEEEVAAEMAAGGFRLLTYQPQGSGPYDSGWAVGAATPTAP